MHGLSCISFAVGNGHALAMRKGGFALMMFSNEKRCICPNDVQQHLKKKISTHRINMSIIIYVCVQDPNVKMLHL